MIFDPNDPRDVLEYHELLKRAQQFNRKIDAKLHTERRTIRQNSYYHLILRYYASQIGITETDAEREFKITCEANRDKFLTTVTDRKGNTHEVIRSSADLSKDEMDSCIRNFIDYAAIYAGINLPYESDYGHIQEAKREIEKVKSYI